MTRSWKPLLASLGLTMCALLVGSCRDKDGRFFIPTPFGPSYLDDVTPPVISNLRPSSNIILNDIGIDYQAIEGIGATGEPVSGLNIPALRATWGTTPLTTTQGTGNLFNIDISSVTQGLQTINIVVPDIAGNQATGSYTFRLDKSGPDITGTVPATGSSTQPSATINLSGGFTDNFGQGASELTVLQAVNGQCNVSNPLYPTGTGPGTVVTNRYQFGLNVNTFNVSVVANGAPNDQRPRTGTYCFYVRSEDQALDRTGVARPNVSGRMFRTDYTWDPAPVLTGSIAGQVTSQGMGLSGVNVFTGTPVQTVMTNMTGNYTIPNLTPGQYTVGVSNLPVGVTCASQMATVSAGLTTTLNFNCTLINFTVGLAFSYGHFGPGDSGACTTITGALTSGFGAGPIALENISGATFVITWTSGTGGLVGSTQRSGTLNAQSQAFDRQSINLFGTYTANVSVTYQGVTRTASGSVNVGAAQGTCPPP